MKRNRFRTLILSLLLFAGLCGCTHAPATESEVPQQSTEPASGNSRFDAAAYKADIEALREIWDQPGQDAPVQAQI